MIFLILIKRLKSSNLRLNFLKAFAMKRPYILPAFALMIFLLNSCSPYKNSATPDDVYYSPSQPVQTAVAANPENSEYYSTPNDNYIRMKAQNPEKWSYFDDYNTDYYASNYGYGPSVGLSIGFGTGFYSPYYGGFGYYSPLSFYNSYYAWNSWYNPYYGGVVVVKGNSPAMPVNTRMASFNPKSYNSSYYTARPSAGNHYIGTGSSRSAQPGYNSNTNSNFSRPSNGRPANSSPSPARTGGFSSGGFSGGGGGASHSGGFSRAGR